jgi:hypothetical protein
MFLAIRAACSGCSSLCIIVWDFVQWCLAQRIEVHVDDRLMVPQPSCRFQSTGRRLRQNEAIVKGYRPRCSSDLSLPI